MRAVDSAGNEMIPVSGDVVIDRHIPDVGRFRVSPINFDPLRDAVVQIRFRLFEPADVKVKVLHKGAVIRRQGPRHVARPGVVRFVWNGRHDRGHLVHEGTYRIVILSIDEAGNRVSEEAGVVFLKRNR